MSLLPHPVVAPPPFEVWISRPRAGERTSSSETAQWLDEQERARAGRFRFEQDRHRYVEAHVLLRRLLSVRIGVAPAHVLFGATESGKPTLCPTACAFSMSRSDELVLIALTDDGEIGVDVEKVRPLPELDALAERCLTDLERAVLSRHPPAERNLAFLRTWTRKEACLKALGTGLQIEPATFDVGVHTGECAVRIETPQGCADLIVQSLPDGADWVGAVARVVAPRNQGCRAELQACTVAPRD